MDHTRVVGSDPPKQVHLRREGHQDHNAHHQAAAAAIITTAASSATAATIDDLNVMAKGVTPSTIGFTTTSTAVTEGAEIGHVSDEDGDVVRS